MEEWNVGMLEYWEGIEAKIIYLNEQKFFKPIIPLLHYSITPIGAKPLSSISGGVDLSSSLMVFVLFVSPVPFSAVQKQYIKSLRDVIYEKSSKAVKLSIIFISDLFIFSLGFLRRSKPDRLSVLDLRSGKCIVYENFRRSFPFRRSLE